MQLVGSAEVHLARENGAIVAKPESVSEGWNVGCELGRIVVDLRARRQKARHEGGARRRAQGARAIGAVENDAVSRERLHVRRAHEGVAVDGQKRRRHLVGHDDENVGCCCGHSGSSLRRLYLEGGVGALPFSVPESRVLERTTIWETGSWTAPRSECRPVFFGDSPLGESGRL